MGAETLTTIFFGVFVALLVVAAVTTVGRVVAKLFWHIPLPRLLIRDAITMAGLTLPFLMIFAARAASSEFKEGLRGNLLWITVTSVPAIIALATYVYFEIFVIGPPKKSTTPNELSQATSPNEYSKVD